MLQQMESVVSSTFWRLHYESKQLQQHLHEVHNMYTLCEIENKVKDGSTSYPAPQKEKIEITSKSGSKLEFRYASRINPLPLT